MSALHSQTGCSTTNEAASSNNHSSAVSAVTVDAAAKIRLAPLLVNQSNQNGTTSRTQAQPQSPSHALPLPMAHVLTLNLAGTSNSASPKHAAPPTPFALASHPSDPSPAHGWAHTDVVATSGGSFSTAAGGDKHALPGRWSKGEDASPRALLLPPAAHPHISPKQSKSRASLLIPAAAAPPPATALAPPSLPPPLMEEVERMLAAAGASWTFDPFALADATRGHPLSTLAYYLIVKV